MGKWITSLIGCKWKLWKGSHGKAGCADGAAMTSLKNATKIAAAEAGRLSESVTSSESSFTIAVATIAQASARDFKLLRQEWAVIRIQTAFRAFLVILTKTITLLHLRLSFTIFNPFPFQFRFYLMRVIIVDKGETSFEGLESIGKASGYISRTAGKEAS